VVLGSFCKSSFQPLLQVVFVMKLWNNKATTHLCLY